MACAEKLGIPRVKQDVDAMLQFDYLINNTDRHFGNFGFIRNVNTLEFQGVAPIFDNGNSLWFDSPIGLISPFKQPAYPFAVKQEKQVKRTDFTNHWFEKLPSDWIENTIQEELAKNELISKERAAKISETVTILQSNLINYAQAPKRKKEQEE